MWQCCYKVIDDVGDDEGNGDDHDDDHGDDFDDVGDDAKDLLHSSRRISTEKVTLDDRKSHLNFKMWKNSFCSFYSIFT